MSDIVSQSSDGGGGWMPQNDARNITRAQMHKTVWKIMDESDNSSNKI
jgi:hypothetical protein